MHLRGYPKYYVKGDRRRAVYYTAEASELRSLGWVPEESAKPQPVPQEFEPAPTPEEAQPVERVEIEVVEEDQPTATLEEPKSSPVFDFMTKIELLEYAMERGVDLPNNMLKAEMVKACKQLL